MIADRYKLLVEQPALLAGTPRSSEPYESSLPAAEDELSGAADLDLGVFFMTKDTKPYTATDSQTGSCVESATIVIVNDEHALIADVSNKGSNEEPASEVAAADTIEDNSADTAIDGLFAIDVVDADMDGSVAQSAAELATSDDEQQDVEPECWREDCGAQGVLESAIPEDDLENASSTAKSASAADALFSEESQQKEDEETTGDISI